MRDHLLDLGLLQITSESKHRILTLSCHSFFGQITVDVCQCCLKSFIRASAVISSASIVSISPSTISTNSTISTHTSPTITSASTFSSVLEASVAEPVFHYQCCDGALWCSEKLKKIDWVLNYLFGLSSGQIGVSQMGGSDQYAWIA